MSKYAVVNKIYPNGKSEVNRIIVDNDMTSYFESNDFYDVYFDVFESEEAARKFENNLKEDNKNA